MSTTRFVIVCLTLLIAYNPHAQSPVNIRVSQVTRFDHEAKRDRNYGFSSTGKYIWLVDDRSTLFVWLAVDRSLVFTRTKVSSRVSFSSDDTLMIQTTKQQSEILNVASGTTKALLEKKLQEYTAPQWISGSNDIVAWIDKSGLGFFNSDSGRLRTVWTEDTKAPGWRHAAISSDRKWILTDSAGIRLWEISSHRPAAQTFTAYGEPTFSPDSHYLGVVGEPSSRAEEVQLLDLQKMTLVNVLPKYAGRIVEWSPDSQKFITDRTSDEGSKNEAVIWKIDGTRMAVIKTYSKHCFDLVSTCISDSDEFHFSPDGRILMVSNKKSVRFLDPNNASVLSAPPNIEGPAFWAPDGNQILAMDKISKTLAVWNFKIE